MTPLCKLAFKYGTDKCPEIKHPYTPFYYDLLKDKKKSIKKVLEIGIGYYDGIDKKDIIYDPILKRDYHRGASLKMWRDFFPNATIYGIDSRREAIFQDERIVTLPCDVRKETHLNYMIRKVGSDVDLVIDDGIHRRIRQVAVCKALMPHLRNDVIYIIEDCRDTASAINDLKENYDCYSPKLINNKRNENLVVVKHKQ